MQSITAFEEQIGRKVSESLVLVTTFESGFERTVRVTVAAGKKGGFPVTVVTEPKDEGQTQEPPFSERELVGLGVLVLEAHTEVAVAMTRALTRMYDAEEAEGESAQ